MCVVGFRRCPRRWRQLLQLPRKKLVVYSKSLSSNDTDLTLIHYDTRVQVAATLPRKFVTIPDSVSVMVQGGPEMPLPAGGASDDGEGITEWRTRAVNLQVGMLAIRDEQAFNQRMDTLKMMASGLDIAVQAAVPHPLAASSIGMVMKLGLGTLSPWSTFSAPDASSPTRFRRQLPILSLPSVGVGAAGEAGVAVLYNLLSVARWLHCASPVACDTALGCSWPGVRLAPPPRHFSRVHALHLRNWRPALPCGWSHNPCLF